MKRDVIKPSLFRAPIIAVLGHVDHGKTTLLDTIRKSNIASRESGGITQHIGAYQIETSSHKKITFIDTPGHEAFTKMRSRGALVADIAILVVAADDGVMPQTEESIRIIKEAGVPFIVALNKIDMPGADPTRVKQQLAKADVLVEGFGGDVVVMSVSAKSGQGVPELLDVLLLLSEMKELKSTSSGVFSGVVIESKKDARKGVLATLIVKSGTLHVGDEIYAEQIKAKVRSMKGDTGAIVLEANESQPVEIMGWESAPQVGAEVTSSKLAKIAAQTVVQNQVSFTLPPLETIHTLKILLKVDAMGSQEAIVGSFGKAIEIVSMGIGEILESDILHAKSTGAIIIGFNVKASAAVATLAEREKVKIKTYVIIYELLDEIGEVANLLNKPEATEEVLGKAQILAEFKSNDVKVAGCRVLEGRIVRGDLVKIMRDKTEVGRTRIKSLKHNKDDIPKAEMNLECGVLLDKKLDFRIGDTIIAYKTHELLA